MSDVTADGAAAGAGADDRNASADAAPARTGRGGRARARRSGPELVLIAWRDIPAQVNGRDGDTKAARILPRRFQKAIDRAAMVAGKRTANEYVAEWRRVALPIDPQRAHDGTLDIEALAIEEQERIEAAFPLERLDRYVAHGGWDPDAPAAATDPSAADPSAAVQRDVRADGGEP